MTGDNPLASSALTELVLLLLNAVTDLLTEKQPHSMKIGIKEAWVVI